MFVSSVNLPVFLTKLITAFTTSIRGFHLSLGPFVRPFRSSHASHPPSRCERLAYRVFMTSFISSRCSIHCVQSIRKCLTVSSGYPHAQRAVFKYAKFDTIALCSLASKLRQGLRCICDPSQTPICGSFNWVVLITFEDGV